ncbi:hypothetical protein AKACHI_12940 [Aquiluna sp. KACHI24]|nr:hypothetical protein AKACHI_12940 [Aquiluna sp. KACHI24]
MKRQFAITATTAMALGLMLGGPAYSNEQMKDPKAAPNPVTYTVQDFTFSGLSIFDGLKYITGSNKYKIAVPRQVKCMDYSSQYFSNCIAYVRSSVETPFSAAPVGTYQPSTFFFVSIVGLTPLSSGNTAIFPAVVKQASVGAEWGETVVYFTAAQSGTVFLRVKKDGSGADIPDIPIQVSVRTQAEIDADNAAKAAAEKAKQDEADRKERERVARILATKLTITCKSGGKTKKVSGDPPVCPRGYSNTMQNQPAFKAYSQCKLYKKQYGYSRAYLQDGGKTLQLDGYGLGWSSIDLTDRDWSCVVRALNIPGSVQNKIGQTRALDGMVSATFGGIEAFWTYHPDNGLDITFSK